MYNGLLENGQLYNGHVYKGQLYNKAIKPFVLDQIENKGQDGHGTRRKLIDSCKNEGTDGWMGGFMVGWHLLSHLKALIEDVET